MNRLILIAIILAGLTNAAEAQKSIQPSTGVQKGQVELGSSRGPAAQRGATAVVGARPVAAPSSTRARFLAPRPQRTPSGSGAGGGHTHDLARARSLFAGADLDGNDQISTEEARLAGIGNSQFAGFDTDGSGGVSRDEFVAGYRALAASAGRSVESDLLAEATRVEAQRMALSAPSDLRGQRGPAAQRQALDETVRPQTRGGALERRNGEGPQQIRRAAEGAPTRTVPGQRSAPSQTRGGQTRATDATRQPTRSATEQRGAPVRSETRRTAPTRTGPIRTGPSTGGSRSRVGGQQRPAPRPKPAPTGRGGSARRG